MLHAYEGRVCTSTTEELCCGKRFCATTTEVHSPRTNVQLRVEEKKLFLRALHHSNNRAAAGGMVDDAIAHLPK